MYTWPNWVYTIWAHTIRAALFPIVVPYRIYEYYRDRNYRGLRYTVQPNERATTASN